MLKNPGNYSGHFHNTYQRVSTPTPNRRPRMLDIWYSLIFCQYTSTRGQRNDLLGPRVKLPPVTTWLTTQRLRQHPIKCLAQGHIKRTCRLVRHTNPL